MKNIKFLRKIDENLKTLICRWVTTFERMKSREAEHLKNFFYRILILKNIKFKNNIGQMIVYQLYQMAK